MSSICIFIQFTWRLAPWCSEKQQKGMFLEVLTRSASNKSLIELNHKAGCRRQHGGVEVDQSSSFFYFLTETHWLMGSSLPDQGLNLDPLQWGLPLVTQQQPASVFLPGKSHGQSSLMGYSPWSHKRIRYYLQTKQLTTAITLAEKAPSPNHWTVREFQHLRKCLKSGLAMQQARMCALISKHLPVAQPVKNPPPTWKTWLQSQGWEDPLEKGNATHSSILAWRIPWTIQSWGHKESDTTERLSLSKHVCMCMYIYIATHSSTLAWRIPWRSLMGYSPRGHKESDTTERLHFIHTHMYVCMYVCMYIYV